MHRSDWYGSTHPGSRRRWRLWERVTTLPPAEANYTLDAVWEQNDTGFATDTRYYILRCQDCGGQARRAYHRRNA